MLPFEFIAATKSICGLGKILLGRLSDVYVVRQL